MTAIHLTLPHSHAVHALWNPSAAARWSLALTPAFGTCLHMLNWEALGQPERAEESKRWFYASVVVLGVGIWLDLAFGGAETASLASMLLQVGLLVIWYAVSARRQIEFVAGEFDDDYPRQPLGKAMGFAIGAFVALLAVSAFLYSLVEPLWR